MTAAGVVAEPDIPFYAAFALCSCPDPSDIPDTARGSEARSGSGQRAGAVCMRTMVLFC